MEICWGGGGGVGWVVGFGVCFCWVFGVGWFMWVVGFGGFVVGVGVVVFCVVILIFGGGVGVGGCGFWWVCWGGFVALLFFCFC